MIFCNLLKMNNLYKYLIVLAAVATVLNFSAAAQTWYEGGDAKTLLKEDITRCTNLHHNYEAPEKIIDTPAPKGYKPFYVSHYGRHGSRYHWTDRSRGRLRSLTRFPPTGFLRRRERLSVRISVPMPRLMTGRSAT